MGPKKVQKPQSRWHPLPEGASTMQVIAVPEIDEYSFHPDDMTKEELLSCCKVIEQSNNTLEIENMIIEKYLTRMDPTSLVSAIEHDRNTIFELRNYLHCCHCRRK